MPSVSHLLISDPGIPFQVQAALRAATQARNPLLVQAYRRRAAFILGESFGLTECERNQLVDLEGDCELSAAA